MIPKNNQSIIIVDESDDITMSDPVQFVQHTMGLKQQVICLTATPDDGIKEGSERNLIELMGFKTVQTSEQQELKEPVDKVSAPLETVADVMKEVHHYSSTRAVLIYANDDLYSQLAQEKGVVRVTMDTPDADLRHMDVKKDGVYPVYLVNAEYGIRGLDY